MKRKNTTTRMMKGYISESLLCLMEKKPFAELSIGEIAVKAGVNRSTYYRHFGSKESVAGYWFASLMDEYLADYAKASDNTPDGYLNSIFTCFYSHKTQLLLIYNNGLSHLILNELNRVFSDEGQMLGERYKRYYHTGGIYNFLAYWMERGMTDSPEEMVRMAADCFPDGRPPMMLAGGL